MQLARHAGAASQEHVLPSRSTLNQEHVLPSRSTLNTASMHIF